MPFVLYSENCQTCALKFLKGQIQIVTTPFYMELFSRVVVAPNNGAYSIKKIAAFVRQFPNKQRVLTALHSSKRESGGGSHAVLFLLMSIAIAISPH